MEPLKLMLGAPSPAASVQPRRLTAPGPGLYSSIHSSALEARVPPQATSLMTSAKAGYAAAVAVAEGVPVGVGVSVAVDVGPGVAVAVAVSVAVEVGAASARGLGARILKSAELLSVSPPLRMAAVELLKFAVGLPS